MARMTMTIGMSRADRAAAWAMLAGLAVALVQCAQALALPSHFA